jgi:hypothetical protein
MFCKMMPQIFLSHGKKLLAFVLALGLLCGGMAINASALTSGDFTYTVSDGKATITGYNGRASTLNIPATLGGYSVTSIGSSAFFRCTSLTSITIPNSVTSFDGNVFNGCSSLTSITVDVNNTAYISKDGVLFNKNGTSLISWPDGKSAVYTIPDGVTSIGGYAFGYCESLISVTIPNSVKNIGACAFFDSTSLTSITIPNGVISIGDSAFYGCTSLTSVTIPNSITRIPWSAFYGCESLVSVIIPASVTSIIQNAFRGCSSLISVTIPSSVTSIGDDVFKGCSSLTYIGVVRGSYAEQYCAQNGIDYVYDIPYSLTVTGGTGSGTYTARQIVNISAAPAPTGKLFDCWTTTAGTIADANSPTTTFTMPADNATVTANYKDVLYTLTVTGGTGGGTYTTGEVMNITANPAPVGKVFDKWTATTGTIADVNSPATTFTMPTGNATVTANYKDVLYTLTVTGGSGGGNYTYGESITLTANPAPAGQVFDKWTTTAGTIADAYSATTTFTMPAGNVTVTANYKDAPKDPAPKDPEPPVEKKEYIKLWGKTTKWEKSPLNWFFLIVCFGWIWMAF